MVRNGHTYHDLIWTYPIDLVYNFYHIAVANEQRDKSFACGLARIASYSARELSKEGAKSVEKLWSEYIAPLTALSKKSGNAKTQNDKMSTGNKAADGMFATGHFQAVKMAKTDGNTGA